jgi:hypothetical protein
MSEDRTPTKIPLAEADGEWELSRALRWGWCRNLGHAMHMGGMLHNLPGPNGGCQKFKAVGQRSVGHELDLWADLKFESEVEV